MLPVIKKATSSANSTSIAFLTEGLINQWPSHLSDTERQYIQDKLSKENACFIHKPPLLNYFFKTSENNKPHYYKHEEARNAGSNLYDLLKQENIRIIEITGNQNPDILIAFLEGLLLSCYSFLKYKKQKNSYFLEEIRIIHDDITEVSITELTNLVKAVFFARHLVNEPLSYLTAECLSREIEQKGNENWL